MKQYCKKLFLFCVEVFCPGPCPPSAERGSGEGAEVSTSSDGRGEAAARWKHACGSLVYLVLLCILRDWKTG